MARTPTHKEKLIFGPHYPPPLRKGDRAFCFVRDCDVVITSWTDARISWPKCRSVGTRGGYSMLVNEELARAIRNESASASETTATNRQGVESGSTSKNGLPRAAMDAEAIGLTWKAACKDFDARKTRISDEPCSAAAPWLTRPPRRR